MKTILTLLVGAALLVATIHPAAAITCMNSRTGQTYDSPGGSCWLGERQIWRGPSDDDGTASGAAQPDRPDDGLHAAPEPSISAHPTMPRIAAVPSAPKLAGKSTAASLEDTERLISDGLKTFSPGPWGGGEYRDISFDRCTLHVKAIIRHGHHTDDYVIYEVPLDDVDSITPADDNLVVDSSYSVETRLAHRVSAGKKKGEWSYLYEREKFISFLMKDPAASQRLAKALTRAMTLCKATG